jgi:outer membrane protein assembly factor BamB
VLAAAAAGGLYYYLPLGGEVTVESREPDAGLGNIATSAPTAKAGPEFGKLIPGKGAPADLPGLWPWFRGPDLDGVSREQTSLAQSWPSGGPRVLWSVPMGEGYAAAAVQGGKVYVLDYDTKARGDALRCLSLADGVEIWRYFYPVKMKENHGFSRTVPAVSGKYVVSLGPRCHVLCVDASTGAKRWSIDLVAKYGTKEPLWYAGQCPLMDGERVILAPAGPDALMIAVDCETGKAQWTAPNPMRWTMTHSCVSLMTFDDRRMFVYFGSGGVAGVSADDGQLLWTTDAFRIVTTVPTPVILPDGRIFCSGGYNAGSMMLQVKGKGGKYSVDVLYRLKPGVFGAAQTTPIYYNSHIYGVRPSGELVCLDEGGKVLWASTGENFGLGPLLIAEGMIYVIDDNGTMTLALANEKGFTRLAKAKVLPGPEAWGPMALAGGRLIVRDLRKMVCLDVSQRK